MPNPSELQREDDGLRPLAARESGHVVCDYPGHGGDPLWPELCEARREIERLERDHEAALHAMAHAGLGLSDVLTVPLACEAKRIALEGENEKLRTQVADLESQLAAAHARADAFIQEANTMRERVGKALAPQPREDNDGA